MVTCEILRLLTEWSHAKVIGEGFRKRQTWLEPTMEVREGVIPHLPSIHPTASAGRNPKLIQSVMFYIAEPTMVSINSTLIQLHILTLLLRCILAVPHLSSAASIWYKTPEPKPDMIANRSTIHLRDIQALNHAFHREGSWRHTTTLTHCTLHTLLCRHPRLATAVGWLAV
jgi:hypothetical protein